MDDNVKIVQAQSEVTALLTREFIANRNLLLYGEINEQTANDMLMLLTKMSAEDPSAPINLYINSPGGDVQAGLTIVDVMNSLKCPVNTICYSLAASMAAVILAAGDRRYKSWPNRPRARPVSKPCTKPARATISSPRKKPSKWGSSTKFSGKTPRFDWILCQNPCASAS